MTHSTSNPKTNWFAKLLPPALWLGVWQLAAMWVARDRLAAGWDLFCATGTWTALLTPLWEGMPFLLPAPGLVVTTLVSLLGTATFWQSVLASVGRIFMGFFAGVLLGTVLAALAHRYHWLHRFLSPAVRVMRATPVACFILLLLLWVQTGRVPTVVTVLMILPLVWGNVYRGIEETDEQLLEFAKSYRFDQWKTIKLVYFPGVFPYFASACHTAAGLAWKAGVAAEVLCLPKQAVGTYVYYTKIYLETPTLFAWTVVIVAMSFGLEKWLGWSLKKIEGGRRK